MTMTLGYKPITASAGRRSCGGVSGACACASTTTATASATSGTSAATASLPTQWPAWRHGKTKTWLVRHCRRGSGRTGTARCSAARRRRRHLRRHCGTRAGGQTGVVRTGTQSHGREHNAAGCRRNSLRWRGCRCRHRARRVRAASAVYPRGSRQCQRRAAAQWICRGGNAAVAAAGRLVLTGTANAAAPARNGDTSTAATATTTDDDDAAAAAARP